jgi:hypothetical protein
MLTLDDIWMRLTTEDIGFFPYRRRDKIPTVPGVYAWFFPLRLGSDPRELLCLYRKVATYDAGCLGAAKWSHGGAGFRWDPLTVEVGRNDQVQLGQAGAKNWYAISEGPQSVRNRFKQALFVSTMFSRPLYVGLTNNLSRRYNEHIAGRGEENNFHSRFNGYMRELKEGITLEQLLFACVPLRKSREEPSEMSDEQISLLEEMLKIICQPVFDDK